MMLQPLARNTRRAGSATIKIIPPPMGGWNATDNLADMAPDEAVTLDNYIPDRNGVRTRTGYESHVTGLGAAVRALMEYNAAGASPKLFAATASAIYDVTTAGAVGAAAVSSLANGNWQHTMFATTGGQFLVIANGADSVRNYDGSSWSTPSITNVTSSTLVQVCSHMSRLWFVQKDTMKVWYLPALAVAGAATSIDFGSLCPLGGELTAMASWSRDGGSGPDDMAVFITSRGEVLVYSGSDPSSTSTWGIVGRFTIPPPIGRRCVVKIGGDVGILTVQGLLSLSTVMPMAASGQAKQAATDKIGRAFRSAALNASALGWQVIEYPKEELVICNVPLVEATEQHQYVLSAHTGKWCRFTGMNAGAWGLKGSDLYWGDNSGTVWKITGNDDNGETIDATWQSSFQTWGSSRTKSLKRIRPSIFGPIGYRPRVAVAVDYEEAGEVYSGTAYELVGPTWDVTEWDESYWGAERAVNEWWQSIRGEGYAVSALVLTSSTEEIVLNGAKLMYEQGDGL